MIVRIHFVMNSLYNIREPIFLAFSTVSVIYKENKSTKMDKQCWMSYHQKAVGMCFCSIYNMYSCKEIILCFMIVLLPHPPFWNVTFLRIRPFFLNSSNIKSDSYFRVATGHFLCRNGPPTILYGLPYCTMKVPLPPYFGEVPPDYNGCGIEKAP